MTYYEMNVRLNYKEGEYRTIVRILPTKSQSSAVVKILDILHAERGLLETYSDWRVYVQDYDNEMETGLIKCWEA